MHVPKSVNPNAVHTYLLYSFVVYLTTLFSVTQECITSNEKVIRKWCIRKDIEEAAMA
jgi:hypothetical protein